MNIQVGDAVLYSIQNQSGFIGWIVHGGAIITNKKDAIAYATKVNAMIQRGYI